MRWSFGQWMLYLCDLFAFIRNSKDFIFNFDRRVSRENDFQTILFWFHFLFDQIISHGFNKLIDCFHSLYLHKTVDKSINQSNLPKPKVPTHKIIHLRFY